MTTSSGQKPLRLKRYHGATRALLVDSFSSFESRYPPPKRCPSIHREESCSASNLSLGYLLACKLFPGRGARGRKAGKEGRKIRRGMMGALVPSSTVCLSRTCHGLGHGCEGGVPEQETQNVTTEQRDLSFWGISGQQTPAGVMHVYRGQNRAMR